MSLSVILNNALSGLVVAEAALRNTSNNVANVNTEGYARKELQQQSRVLAGAGVGVEVGEVRRVVDEFLVKELRIATSHAKQFSAMGQIHDRLQGLLGDPSNGSTLATKLDQVFTSMAALGLDPDSLAARTTTVGDLQELAQRASDLALQVQTLRAEADRQVKQSVDKVNEALNRVAELNSSIVRETQSGRDATALEDQRAEALDTIAEVLDVRTFDSGGGAVTVVTNSGEVLVDDRARQLVYQNVGVVTAGTTFQQLTVNTVNQVTGVADPNGTPLNARIRAGALRGWLDMRDVELPQFAASLGELSANVIDQMNAIHNANVAVPPPAALSGRNSGLAATDAHNFSGRATFDVFDANNDILATTTIDFGAIGPTMNDVITAVNAGLGGAGVLALTNGVLSFSAAGAGAGVAIEQDATTPADRGGRGFSHFFGLNDLMEAKVEAHFDTGVTAAQAHGFTGTTNIQFLSPNNEAPVSFTLDFATIGATFGDIVTALNTQFAGAATFALDGNGAIVATPAAGFEDFSLRVTADGSARGATGLSFSQMFGFGERFQMEAARDATVVAPILQDPIKMALAKVDAAGSPALTAADNRGALAFQNLTNLTVSFAAAGDISAVQATLTDYTAQVLGTIGAEAAQVDSLKSDREALQTELGSRLAEVSGVNLDEEMAQMVVFQTAYNAAARMITTTNELFDVLIRI